MNVLLLGNGGREFTFAWKIAQSPLLSKLYIAPGNAGTMQFGENVSLDIHQFEEIEAFCVKRQIDLLIVGPEEPLVKGIRDYFTAMPRLAHIKVFGPGKSGARLEGSKEFAKIFMTGNGIPTAPFASFTHDQAAYAHNFIDQLQKRYVIKADGLAAGKGVIIPANIEEAHRAIDEILVEKKFGDSGNVLLIEEFMEGTELSVFVITDGNHYKILPTAQDYKRVGENNKGPNTGGMGAVSPVPHADEAFMQKVEEQIVKPTINGLKDAEIEYTGVIFIGLMRVGDQPFVVEYNVRMGDPETEVVLPRIESDLLQLILKTCDGELNDSDISISSSHAVTVMLVSGGYPGNYEKGKTITGFREIENGLFIHAGTQWAENNVITSGGRVMACTAWAPTLPAALERAYDMAADVDFENLYYRRDIGVELL
jgi:phosphoribosylamine--glycine ligase